MRETRLHRASINCEVIDHTNRNPSYKRFFAYPTANLDFLPMLGIKELLGKVFKMALVLSHWLNACMSPAHAALGLRSDGRLPILGIINPVNFPSEFFLQKLADLFTMCLLLLHLRPSSSSVSCLKATFLKSFFWHFLSHHQLIKYRVFSLNSLWWFEKHFQSYVLVTLMLAFCTIFLMYYLYTLLWELVTVI